MFCPVNCFNYTVDRSDDFVGGLCPSKRLRLLVVDFQIGADRFLQRNDRAVSATSQLVLGQAGEEALDQVEPRAVGRREMAVEARVAEKPLPDPGRLVRAVVVEDQMNVELRRDELSDVPQEADEIDGAVAALDLADDPAGGDIQRREQRRRAIASIVVGARLGRSVVQRQRALRAIERLYLAFLVDAQHQRPVRRIEIEADDIAHLLDKMRIGRQLEAARQVGLQAEGAPDAMNEVPR